MRGGGGHAEESQKFRGAPKFRCLPSSEHLTAPCTFQLTRVGPSLRLFFLKSKPFSGRPASKLPTRGDSSDGNEGNHLKRFGGRGFSRRHRACIRLCVASSRSTFASVVDGVYDGENDGGIDTQKTKIIHFKEDRKCRDIVKGDRTLTVSRRGTTEKVVRVRFESRGRAAGRVQLWMFP